MKMRIQRMSKKVLALLVSVAMLGSMINMTMFIVTAGPEMIELNLLPETEQEIANKIETPAGGINVTLKQDGSVELFSQTGWPNFRFKSATNFVPADNPLYLYYDFTLTGGGSQEMRLDIQVNDTPGEDPYSPAKNIFKNNTAETTKASDTAYKGVINVTEVFGNDIAKINSVVGLISGENMRLTFRELRLSTVSPNKPQASLNLLPETEQEIANKIETPSGGINVTLKQDGSVELFSQTGWPNFRFKSATNFVPADNPLYLYYDFTLTGGGSQEMRLDIQVNDTPGEDPYSPAKNIFKNNTGETTKASDTAYKGVINVTEVFGNDIEKINSVVGLISGENMRLTFRQLRLSTIAPVEPQTELNLLPETEQEIANKIELPGGNNPINVTLNQDGSVELFNQTGWPSFRFKSATNFVPANNPLYLYYDFTLTGGGSQEMRLDIQVNDTPGEDVNTPAKNIFKNNTGETTKAGETPCKGVINVTEVFGNDIEKINSVVGLISGENMRLTFRELRLSIIAPVEPQTELNLLPETEQEIANKIELPGGNNPINVTLNQDGSVELFNQTGWPSFRFKSATNFVPADNPLYLYYDFTLTGGGSQEMRLDIQVNDTPGEDVNTPAKNIFKNNTGETTKAGETPYKGVINVTEVFGNDIEKINSVVGLISGENMRLTFRELRLSTIAPVEPQTELNLLPETEQEIANKIELPAGGIDVTLKQDGSVELFSANNWPSFRFKSATNFVPADNPLYLYYDFTLTGEGGSNEIRLDVQVNDTPGEDPYAPAKNIFKNNTSETTKVSDAAYKGVINVTEVFGNDIAKINSVVGLISGENMRLTFRELRLSTTAPVVPPEEEPVEPKTELNLLPETEQEIANKIELPGGGIDVTLKQDGSVELFSANNWPNFRFKSATNFVPADNPLYLYYDFTLTGEGGSNEMRLDVQVNDTPGEDPYKPTKNIFKNNTEETTKVSDTAYKGVINVTEVFGNDIEKINSVVGIISGINMRLTFRELRLSTVAPIKPQTSLNLLPETEQEIANKIELPGENNPINVTLKQDGSVELFNQTGWPSFRFKSATNFIPADNPLYLYYDFTLTGGGSQEMRLDIQVNDTPGEDVNTPAKNIFKNNTGETTKAGETPCKGVINVTEVFGNDIAKINSVVGLISGENMRLTFRELRLSTVAPNKPQASLNLLPETEQEIANKIELPGENNPINVTLKQDGSVELFNQTGWPSFRFKSATNFIPADNPLYLYYDFTLTGGGSQEMRLDIQVNDTPGEDVNTPAKNIFKNNTGETTKASDTAYKGVINVTEVFGNDIEKINSVVGLISGENMRLTFRELRLSTIAPVEPQTELNLLPEIEQEIANKIETPSGGINVTLKQDGLVELFSANNWPNFRFIAATNFVPADNPLYLYYDFTLTGEGGSNEMRLDVQVNDTPGEDPYKPAKNIFKNNTEETTKVSDTAYKGVINVTEVFGNDIAKINSVVGLISGVNMRLTFRELRLSVIPPKEEPVEPKTELNLLPETEQEIANKIELPVGGIDVTLKEDGSVELFSAESWPNFRFTAATNFVPADNPLYLYYDFTLTGEGGDREMRLDVQVNDTLGDERYTPAKHIFKNNAWGETTKVGETPCKGVINVTEVVGEDIEKINSIVGLISGINMRLTFRELRLSVIPPKEEPVEQPKELNLLPETEQEIANKIELPVGGIDVTLKEDGSVELFSAESWPNFRFSSATNFVPADNPLYLYYDFTLIGEGGDREMRLDVQVNDTLGDERYTPAKHIFKNNAWGETTKVGETPCKGVINLTEVFGEDIEKINSIVGLISGINMRLTFRELRLSVIPPKEEPVEQPKELNLLPETEQEIANKIELPVGGIDVTLKEDGSVELFSAESWPNFRFSSATNFVPADNPLYLYYDFTLIGEGGDREMRLDVQVNDTLGDERYTPAKHIFKNNAWGETTKVGETPCKGVINLTEVFGEDIEKINSIVGLISGINMRLTFRELRLSVIPPKEEPVEQPKELNLLPETEQEIANKIELPVGGIDVTLKEDGSVELFSPENWPNFRFISATGFVPADNPLYLYYDFTLFGTGGDREMRLDVQVNDTLGDEPYTPAKNIFTGNTAKTTPARAGAYKGVINVTEVFGNDIEKINSIVGLISGTNMRLTFRELKLSVIKPDGPTDTFENESSAGVTMVDDVWNLLPTTQEEVENQFKIYSNFIGTTGPNGEKLTVTLNDDQSVTIHNATSWPFFNFADAEGLAFIKSPVYLYYDFTLSMGAEMRFDVHVNDDHNIYDVGKNVLERYTDTTTKGKPNAYKGAINLTELFGEIDVMNGICCIISGTDVSVTFRQFELSYITPETVVSNDRLNVVVLDPMKDNDSNEAKMPVFSTVVWYVVGGACSLIVVAGIVVCIIYFLKKRAKNKENNRK